EKQLHAEAAAHITRDDADAVLRDLEDAVGEQVTQEMRALRRAPQCVGILARIVFADRAARLHRIDDDAVVDELKSYTVARAGRSSLHRGTIADLPVEAEIARGLVPHQGLDRFEGVRGINHGGEGVVIDRDELRRITRRRDALPYNDPHPIAAIPYPHAPP